MQTFSSEKTLYMALNHDMIEEKDEDYQDDPLASLKKNETNLYGDGYEDDVFKINS